MTFTPQLRTMWRSSSPKRTDRTWVPGRWTLGTARSAPDNRLNHQPSDDWLLQRFLPWAPRNGAVLRYRHLFILRLPPTEAFGGILPPNRKSHGEN
jgi:hypothetical protein